MKLHPVPNVVLPEGRKRARAPAPDEWHSGTDDFNFLRCWLWLVAFDTYQGLALARLR